MSSLVGSAALGLVWGWLVMLRGAGASTRSRALGASAWLLATALAGLQVAWLGTGHAAPVFLAGTAASMVAHLLFRFTLAQQRKRRVSVR